MSFTQMLLDHMMKRPGDSSACERFEVQAELWVETPRCHDQREIALLNEIGQRQPEGLVASSEAKNEAKIAFDETMARVLSLFGTRIFRNPPEMFLFFRKRERGDLRQILQIPPDVINR